MNRAVSFTLLGLAVAASSVAGCGGTSEQQTACVVHVYFTVSATQAQIDAVGARLDRDPNVRTFEFISKEAALVDMGQRYPELVQNLKSNPFPASFEVVPKRKADDRLLARELGPAPGVDGVRLCPPRSTLLP